MNDSLIKLDFPAEGFAILSLNRPEKRNALSIDLMDQFCSAMESLKSHRVIIIKGNGACFCAGMDLHQAGNPELLPDVSNSIAKTFMALYHSPAVTIAQVHGYSVAGGAGLMAACDFAVAEKNTLIGFPEVRLGLVPSQVMAILMRRIRRCDMVELFYRGALVDVKRAYEMGLINGIASGEEDLHLQSEAIAQDILKGGPEAIRHTKMLTELLSVSHFEDDLMRAKNFYQGNTLPNEAKEGINARNEKREPTWSVNIAGNKRDENLADRK